MLSTQHDELETPAPRMAARGRWGPRVAVGVALLGVLGASMACAAADTSTPPTGGAAPTVAVPQAAVDLQQTVINVIHAVQPSVVEVQSSNFQGEAIGSGEVISSDGNIVTNDHVVHGFDSYQVVLSNGKSLPASLVGESPADDLAVLKVGQTGMRPINFADSSAAQVGEFVLAIGTPLGLQQSATFGIISALNRTASEAPSGPAGTLTGLIQTSAPINPGNSGGALVDLTGKLVGIPTLAAADPNSNGAANGIGFAIPSNRVKFVADQLVKSGKVTNTGQGFLGVVGGDVTPDLQASNNLPIDHGFLISGFTNDATGNSPAQKAGLQAGDIIIECNGTTVNGNGDLAGVLQQLAPGTKVSVKVQRGNSQVSVSVTLGERPTNANG
ncbi:MAG TPA: trypsin-like peptidase domain-containing protein [Ktedonobacterales bacterium]|nr:trypsin-like peptidase domain-containing protein [Ktedonobacterales bacterium]